jgi:hypothetical protein
MGYFVNGVKTTKKKLFGWLGNPKTIVKSVSFEIGNPSKKKDESTTMEGVDIPRELLINMAKQADRCNAIVTATFSNCGNLGGKTIVIKVGDFDPESDEEVMNRL